MTKKDVLDTVDIFFGTGKAATPEPETKQLQQEISAELDRLEAELSPLQAKAERRAAARNKASRDGGRKRPAASAVPSAATVPAAAEETDSATGTPERERISFVLPYEQVEYLKNYKYSRALADGDPQYTLTEALIEAIELLRKHSTYEVFERPDFVRAREKKPRR